MASSDTPVPAWRNLVRSGLSRLVETVFPPRCAGCGVRGVWVCDACLEREPGFRRPWCEGCGIPVVWGNCECDGNGWQLDRVRTFGAFGGWLRVAIHEFKYQGVTARSNHLSALLTPLLLDLAAADALVAVPLHAARERARGYNQATLLARQLAHSSAVPLWSGLERTRNTPHQIHLTAEERNRNMAGAFAIDRNRTPVPERIVLIDDVFTTGATLRAAAASLRQGGAQSVSAVTLARDV